MIPHMPFPDDFSGRIEFKNGIGPETFHRLFHRPVGVADAHLAERFGLASFGDGFFAGFVFPGRHHGIAVGEALHSMMEYALFAVYLKFPYLVAFPVEFFNQTGVAAEGNGNFVAGQGGTAEQMSVGKDDGAGTVTVFAFPDIDDVGLVVDEEGLRAPQRGEYGVTVEGLFFRMFQKTGRSSPSLIGTCRKRKCKNRKHRKEKFPLFHDFFSVLKVDYQYVGMVTYASGLYIRSPSFSSSIRTSRSAGLRSGTFSRSFSLLKGP